MRARPDLVLSLLCVAILTACHSRSRSATIPPSLLAMTSTPTSVFVRWVDGSLAEDGYRVERSENGGAFVVAGTVGRDVTLYVDSGLKPATKYAYRVHAYTNNGAELGSDPVDVETKPAYYHAVSPTRIFAAGGQVLEITGAGFSAGVDEIRIGGTVVGHQVLSDTAVRVTTPPLTRTGDTSLSVKTPSSLQASTDALTTRPWPPQYDKPKVVRDRLVAMPESVQIASDRGAAHLFWIEPAPLRIAYALRLDGGQTTPTQVAPSRDQPWHLHAAVSGKKIYVVWMSFGDLYVSRSIDGGVKYEAPVKVPMGQEVAFNPRIAASGDDVHVLYVDERQGQGVAYHTVSHDGGKTFKRAPVRISGFLGVRNARLVVKGPDAYAVWWSPIGKGRLLFQRSTDRGVTWPHQDHILTIKPGEKQPTPAELGVARGRVFVVAEEPTVSGNRVAVMHSPNGGRTWDQTQWLDSDGSPSRTPRLAFGDAGEGVCVTWDEDTQARFVQASLSTDGGATWTLTPQVARATTSIPARPSADCDGRIVIAAYVGGDPAEQPELKLLHSKNGGKGFTGPQNFGTRLVGTPQMRFYGCDIHAVWLQELDHPKRWSLHWCHTKR